MDLNNLTSDQLNFLWEALVEYQNEFSHPDPESCTFESILEFQKDWRELNALNAELYVRIREAQYNEHQLEQSYHAAYEDNVASAARRSPEGDSEMAHGSPVET